MSQPISVSIITSAHWIGDPRLNRHVQYLESGGIRAHLASFAEKGRMRGLVAALRAVPKCESEIVLLPDPELFLLGPLAALIFRKKPVIDIHEDYPKAAASRVWIPDALRPFVRLLATFAVWAGRRLAWRVIVAAPQLSQEGDWLVVNIPDPSSFDFGDAVDSNRLIYVGDITESRGALEMIDVLAGLGDTYELTLIGGIHPALREQLEERASQLGVRALLALTGRLEHHEAWSRARGALAGLNLLRAEPAYIDAVATKIWEYMALGLPPVVSDLPGQSAVVSQLDATLVCAGVDEVVDIIEELSRDSAKRSSIARKGREMTEEMWSELRPDRTIQEAVRP